MLRPPLIEYLNKVKSYNPTASEADLRLVLKSSGWKPEEIEEGIAYGKSGGGNMAAGAAPAAPSMARNFPPTASGSSNFPPASSNYSPSGVPSSNFPPSSTPSRNYVAPQVSPAPEENYDLMPQPRKPTLQYESPSLDTEGHGKKVGIIIGIVIFLVLIGGGITYAVMNGITLDSLNLFSKKPTTDHLYLTIYDNGQKI